jgi:2-iminobutanoate/2-iminopropanoate deaminase
VSVEAPEPAEPLPPTGGPYTLARRLPNGLIFVAGQTGVDPVARRVIATGVEAQTLRAIDNVAAVLAAEGAALADVVQVTVHLAREEDFQAMNAAYARRFEPPYPVRTTVVAGLGPDALVEITAVAFVAAR